MRALRSSKPTFATTTSCAPRRVQQRTGQPDILIQDTAWRDYEEIPQWIVDGYSTMFDEIDAQLGERLPQLLSLCRPASARYCRPRCGTILRQAQDGAPSDEASLSSRSSR